MQEVTASFACFGSQCAVIVGGDGPSGTAAEAVAMARDYLLEWHARFSRFESQSELSRLNQNPEPSVHVSPLMARFVATVVEAAQTTGGLVDATLLTEIERAGYAHDHQTSVPLESALAHAPPRKAAGPSAARRWAAVEVDMATQQVSRPPGVMLDSGGLAKGLFADVLGEMLAPYRSFAIDCAGDLRIGGLARAVRVASPFDAGQTLHELIITNGGVATSGVGKRSWLDETGSPAHHLLDPATGRPAYTGVVQVTAQAPTAREAEMLTKAAILSGPEGAAQWLRYGGVIVADDRSVRVIDGPADSLG